MKQFTYALLLTSFVVYGQETGELYFSFFSLINLILKFILNSVANSGDSRQDYLDRPLQQFRSEKRLIDEKGFMDIIGLYSSIMGIYDSITNPSTGELAAQIKEGFQRVEQQLASIQQSINEVISIILDQSIRTQYASTERVITESLRCYNSYLNMTSPEGQEYWRQEFLKVGGLLRESVSFLLDGMLGRNIFAGDLLLTVVNNEKVTR